MRQASEGTAPREEARRSAATAPEEIMLHMALGKWVCKALTVAADIGVADVLREGPLSAAEIARRTGSDGDALYRLLRALASLGVFEEVEARQFANNAVSSTLRSDVPGSVRAMVRWIGEEAAWVAWNGLAHSVRTGRPAFDHVFGEPLFEYFGKHPETGRIFDEAMTSLSAGTGAAVARAYDFPPHGRVVDVGGGQGALLLAILERFPEAEGILFDRPGVIEGARSALSSSAAAGRIELRAGDFFEGVPGDGEAYVLQHILHDWDDDRCVRILAHCRQAMAEGGSVLVLEQPVRDGPGSGLAKLLDLEMLAMTPGGRERTEAEYASLFERAGLRLARIVPTDSMVSVLEGVAAGPTMH